MKKPRVRASTASEPIPQHAFLLLTPKHNAGTLGEAMDAFGYRDSYTDRGLLSVTDTGVETLTDLMRPFQVLIDVSCGEVLMGLPIESSMKTDGPHGRATVTLTHPSIVLTLAFLMGKLGLEIPGLIAAEMTQTYRLLIRESARDDVVKVLAAAAPQHPAVTFVPHRYHHTQTVDVSLTGQELTAFLIAWHRKPNRDWGHELFGIVPLTDPGQLIVEFNLDWRGGSATVRPSESTHTGLDFLNASTFTGQEIDEPEENEREPEPFADLSRDGPGWRIECEHDVTGLKFISIQPLFIQFETTSGLYASAPRGPFKNVTLLDRTILGDGTPIGRHEGQANWIDPEGLLWEGFTVCKQDSLRAQTAHRNPQPSPIRTSDADDDDVLDDDDENLEDV